MEKIITLLLGLTCLTSCTKDYDVKITGVDFHPIRRYDNFSAETEFLGPELIFTADFSLDPSHGSGSPFGPRVGDVDYINPVIEEKFVLTANKDIFTINDTLKTGENLSKHFEYIMLKKMFYLSYNFRSTETFLNETGYFRFYFTAVLSDNSEVSDSCLVKINF